MFLKDHLKDTYQKASFDNNHLMLENIINVWAHRFGPESLNELFIKNQINLELLKNVQYEEEIEFKPKETKTPNNTEIIEKDIDGSYKNESEYKDTEELPLPNIKNLRKWINNEKKAS